MIGQYTTLTEARLMVEILRAYGMPVALEDPTDDYHNDTSGIYLMPWTNAGNQPEPKAGEAREYLYRLKNGFGGDIGMIFAVAQASAAPAVPANMRAGAPMVPAGPPRYDIAIQRELAYYKFWLSLNPEQADRA